MNVLKSSVAKKSNVPSITSSPVHAESPSAPLNDAESISPHGPEAPPFFSTSGKDGSFSGHLQFYSCPVISPSGLQCPRGSFVHAPFCRFHLQSVLGLDTKDSTIPKAGRGLFTLTPRSKG